MGPSSSMTGPSNEPGVHAVVPIKGGGPMSQEAVATSSRSRRGIATTVIAIALTALVSLSGAAIAQEATTERGSGEGTNLVLTLVDAKSPFFRTGPASVATENADAFVRRASVAGDSDQQMLVARIGDGDVLGPQLRAIAGIDLLAEVGGTVTVWGEVLQQSQPLVDDTVPRVGFILGLFGGRDALVRDEAVEAAAGALQQIDGVFLVARVRGGADLLAMYEIDGADLSAGLQTAGAIQDALAANELEIEIEGIGF